MHVERTAAHRRPPPLSPATDRGDLPRRPARLAAALGLAVVLGLCLAAPRPAAACGVWRMIDPARGLAIRWLVNSAEITRGDRRLAALYLDLDAPGGPRVVAGRRVVFDVRDGVLRRFGRPVGALDADGAIAIGAARFAVALDAPHERHGMTAWRLEVRRGDQVVVTSDEATALCAAGGRGGAPRAEGPPTEAEAAADQAELRRRVAFYLLWRELGARP